LKQAGPLGFLLPVEITEEQPTAAHFFALSPISTAADVSATQGRPQEPGMKLLFTDGRKVRRAMTVARAPDAIRCAPDRKCARQQGNYDKFR